MLVSYPRRESVLAVPQVSKALESTSKISVKVALSRQYPIAFSVTLDTALHEQTVWGFPVNIKDPVTQSVNV